MANGIISLPTPTGPWKPWTNVLALLNPYLAQRYQAGNLPLPIEVTALRDSDGGQLFSIVITQSATTRVTPLAPVLQLTLTIIDGAGDKDHLRVT